MSVDLVTAAVHLPIVFNCVETELSVKRCLIGPPDKTCLPGIRRDRHLLFEVEMYLQKGCIMVSGVGSS